jgi:LacI family transcriptional regulator
VAATLSDVARQAGVSTATASRALSGSRPVSPDLAAQVEAAARRLRYRPNAVARALRTQATQTVGMVVPEISNPFFPALVEAVERRLQDSGRDLLLCDSQGQVDVELRRVRALLSRRIDGLIVSPVSTTASAQALDEARSAGTRVVQVDRYVEGHRTHWVGVDDDAGIGAVVAHVAAQGARSCVFVGAGTGTSSGRLRLDAYRRAARRARLAASSRPLLGDFTVEWGRTAARRLLAGPVRPDAVVCGNDAIALGVLRELLAAGVGVPTEVMVTGFDDIGFAVLADPPLTTVRQPSEGIADSAISLLDRARGPVRRVSVAPSLVVRGSTVRGAVDDR